MEVMSTNKGKPMVHYLGYAYRKHRENAKGVVSWLCQKQKSKRCTGRLKSSDGTVLEVTDHQCGPPDEAALCVKKHISKAKKRAREESTPISQIYTEEIGDLHNRGYDFVTEIPSTSSVKRILQINRSDARGNQEEPKSRDDIILDEECLKMCDGSSFLLRDDSTGPRILIFSGEKNREALKNHKTVFMDGTFKSCSKQFAQIYTIHADFDSSSEETNVHPVIFALLPDKKRETYVRMFRLILDSVPEWNPQQINLDFEAAAISAIRQVFPEAEINGCYFHFKKCLWRKVQELGLTDNYRKNEQIRLSIKMCASLAFLEPVDVGEGFLLIHSQASKNEKLELFFDYFVDQWLENPEIPESLWSCHQRRHRTTNAVEGWHHKINYNLLKPKPRVKDVIHCLKKEAETTTHMHMRLELNLEGKRRKTKYVKSDERIKKNVLKYQETGDIMCCLRALAYIQKID